MRSKRDLIKFKYLGFVLCMLLISCGTNVNEKQIPLAQIRRALLSNIILSNENVETMPFAKIVSIGRASMLRIYYRDSCFSSAIDSILDTDFNKFVILHKMPKIYELTGGTIDIEKGQFAIYVYPLAENIYVGYIRQHGIRPTSYEYQFYIVFEEGQPKCTQVYEMSGSL
jgi:hypothetical protein